MFQRSHYSEESRWIRRREEKPSRGLMIRKRVSLECLGGENSVCKQLISCFKETAESHVLNQERWEQQPLEQNNKV